MTIDSVNVAVRTLRLQVDEVIEETADSVTVVFSSPLDYRPGQFLTLDIPTPDGGSIARCYSLCSSPDTGERPAISVKRTVGGAASNWLCDNAASGAILTSLLPAGTFVPTRWDRPLLLIAAGSGITPVMSILKTALASHRENVVLLYANRSRDSVMFASALDDLLHRFPTRLTVEHWLESESGVPTEDRLRARLPSTVGADAYLCGPEPFMEIARRGLAAAGMPTANIHHEVFSSLSSNPFHATAAVSGGVGTPVTATVEGEEHSFHCPPGTVLLDAMLAEGIDAPFVCREGNCGACAFTITSGEVHMRVNDTLDDYEVGKGMRLACQSVPISPSITLDID